MSIKFRPNDLVVLNIKYSDDTNKPEYVIVSSIEIEIGPIINRVKCGWSTYRLTPPEHIDIIKTFQNRINSYFIHRIVIEYREFKIIVKDFKASELLDRFSPFTIEDMMDDLDFIVDEIT